MTAVAVFLDGAQILANMKSLGPAIEAAADDIEAEGRLTDDLLRQLRAGGAFRMAWPARWGGPEMRIDDQLLAIEALAYHDASVAWNVQILLDSGYYAGQLEEAAARDLYPSMDLATAGGYYPPARADWSPDGWRVSGSWPFGSGIYSADRVIGGVHLYRDGQLLTDERGRPEFRVAYLPQDQVQLLDTWNVTGLRGTGSTHYRIEDAVVPDDRIFSFFTVGGLERPPLSRYPTLVGQTLPGVILGAARRYLDDAIAFLAGKSHDRYLRVSLAEAETLLGAARAYVLDVAARLTDALFDGRPLTPAELAAATMSSVNAGRAGQQAIELATELVGTRAIYVGSPFERRRRDALTLLAHIGHQRRLLETAGGALLGDDDLPQLA